jgi:hypothetical protein
LDAKQVQVKRKQRIDDWRSPKGTLLGIPKGDAVEEWGKAEEEPEVSEVERNKGR